MVKVIKCCNFADKIDSDSPQAFLNTLHSKRAQPLTKENVKLMEISTRMQQLDFQMAIEPSQTSTQQHKTFKDLQPPTKSTNEVFNHMMNSTKIDENEKQWRQATNSDTESAEDLGMTASENTLGGYSPIKGQSPSKDIAAKQKRFRSPNPMVDEFFSQKENAENEYANKKRLPRRLVQAPLDDVSSSLLNNLRISSPDRDQPTSPVQNVRKCSTDLGHRDFRKSEENRFYAVQNRSPDCPKLSLPNYGIHGPRFTHQEAVTRDKRSNSRCSTNSEFTHNDGKFPLKSNTPELVWECVKLQKSVVKSFVIKNTSEKKLSLKMGISGPGFQLSSTFGTDLLVLQGNECRTISITFCPTVIGKAIGKVCFKPTKSWPDDIERSVFLWAYGGSTVLQLQGIERGPVGSTYLKMGETSHITTTTLKRTFSIYNKGPLNGVATIFIKQKTNRCIENYITIEPSKCVIRANCSATISVTYKLRRKDLDKLKEKSCEVLTVGTLEVIFGSEPNRQRIAAMLTRNGTIPLAYRQLEFLVNDFPVASVERFDDYHELITNNNVNDLFGCFKTSEIALTINRTNLDETQDVDLSAIDESVFFRTLIETPKQNQPTMKPMATGQSDEKMCSVQPKRLNLDTGHNSRTSFTIQSFFSQTQTFQVDSDHRQFFKFSTTSSRIQPGAEFKIDIELKKDLYIPSFNGAIAVYFEKDCIEIPVNVTQVPY